MTKVGNYEILDEVSVTQHGSVSRARQTSGERGVFAVKRFHVANDDPSEPHWGLQTFLDRARVQQTLAAGGAKRWAPIHDLGINVDTAYYVTDYLPLSAQKLIDGRVRLKSGALYAIVLGVVQGLSELKALRNRSHGNLNPRNVLISGNELPGAAVLLTDPATNGQAARLGEAGDMRALGELIHLLVTQRPAGAGEWQLRPGNEWNSLGADSATWRKLCSDLLNPDPAIRLKLANVGQRLGAIRPRQPMRLGKVFAVAAVLALLAGVAVVALTVLDRTARNQFCQARRDWFGKFATAVADTDHRKRWQADSDLLRIMGEVPADKIQAIDCDDGKLFRWKYGDYKAIRDANAVVSLVADELPAHWSRAMRAADLQKRFADRGWTQPAEYLAQLTTNARPGPGVDLPAGIDHLLLASPNVEAGFKLADKDWQQFIDRIHNVETAHDKVLTALADKLKASASSDVKLADSGFTGLDDLKRDVALAARLSDAIAANFPTNIDREPFDREVAAAIDLKNPQRQDIEKWLSILDDNTMRHQEALTSARELRERFNETVQLINHSRVSSEEMEPFETASHQAIASIAEFEQMTFTRRTLADGSFERKRDEVSNKIEALRKFYHPLGPKEWLDALPAVATSSDRINGFWKAWRTVLQDELPAMLKDSEAFKAKQQASEQLRGLLVSLDQTFPPAPKMPSEPMTKATRTRREQMIEQILPKIDLRSPKLDPQKLNAATDAYNQWNTNLVLLSQNFPITKELLGPGDRPDEKWKKQKPEFWNDPLVQGLIKDDVGRLDRIAALASQSRDGLIKAMSGGGEAEVALEAWHLLGQPAIQPPWPSRGDELSAELKFRQRLATSLKGLKDPAEAEGPTQLLAEQAPIRWRTFVENATSEPMLKEAWAQREAFTVDDRQVAKLSDVAIYNLDLSRLHEALAANDDHAIKEGLSALSTAAAALKERPLVADLPARIARVADKEPFADRTPGDVFGITFPGQTRPVEFKRVEPASDRPFYLCTTCVSAGQFAAVLDATGSWGQARQLPWPYAQGKPDPRHGPRTWEWGGPPTAPLTIPLVWLTPEDYNDFLPVLRKRKFNRMTLGDAVGGDPSPDHPMQYVSAEAALFYAGVCGCRLPTPAEWQEAYSHFEKDVPIERWNLRDQTWEAQRKYVASLPKKWWPDEGIFADGASESAVGSSAASRSENDGSLFFQPVGNSGASIFRHLVGNVAEYVCDAPQAFDQSDKSAAGVKKFVDQWSKALFVIGGSALSPPEAPYDKPLPLAHPDECYADVGLRLAFTAPSRSLAEKVKWTVGAPPFLWPQVAAANGK